LYKKNIIKKGKIIFIYRCSTRFFELAKESMIMEKSRNHTIDGTKYKMPARPKTALPR
jgi:hypothetical protein